MASADGFRGSLAAVSTVSGILAGVLGGWLTGRWLWGAACGFLILLGVAAGAEAIKARRENSKEASATVSLNDNASLGDTLIAGRDLTQNRISNKIHHQKTTNIRAGSPAAVLAVVALGTATGGTLYMSQQPGVAIESPQTLASEGSHSSPDSAVKGLLGNLLIGNIPGACGYLLPDEQSECNAAYAARGSQPSVTGSVGVGSAVVNGTLALVPVTGKICSAGRCVLPHATGLPPGASFLQAYRQAMGSSNGNGNLFPCDENDGVWYVSIPGL